MKPWYTEGPRDWQTLFAITRFRYIEVLTIVLLGGKKIVRYTEDFVLYRSSSHRGSTRSISSHFRASNRSYAPGPHFCDASTLITAFFLLLLLLFFLEGLTSFSEITEDSDVASKMKEVYQDINNIDLWVGGLAEDHEEGSELGPTFRAWVKATKICSKTAHMHTWFWELQVTINKNKTQKTKKDINALTFHWLIRNMS